MDDEEAKERRGETRVMLHDFFSQVKSCSVHALGPPMATPGY